MRMAESIFLLVFGNLTIISRAWRHRNDRYIDFINLILICELHLKYWSIGRPMSSYSLRLTLQYISVIFWIKFINQWAPLVRVIICCWWHLLICLIIYIFIICVKTILVQSWRYLLWFHDLILVHGIIRNILTIYS